MKNKQYSTVPKFKRKIVDGYRTDTLTHIYMTAHFPGLVQALE